MFSPDSGRDIKSLPPAKDGEGQNGEWLPRWMRILQLAGKTQEEAIVIVYESEPRQRRPFKPGEVERAAATIFGTNAPTGPRTPRIALLSPAAIRAHVGPVRSDAEVLSLPESSPLPTDTPTAEIISILYPDPAGWIAFKRSNESPGKRCRISNVSAFLATAEHPFQFFTSSYVSGRKEATQDGRLSYVAKKCFSAQRFVVVEFDGPRIGDQLARILFLRDRLERHGHGSLAMILHSGGKSLHAHFRPLSADVADVLRVAAIKIGADPAAMRINQLVRCPQQQRDNGRMQQLLWLARPQ